MKQDVRTPRCESETASLRGRHERLLRALPEGSVALVLASGGSGGYPPSRPNQDFVYISGLDEPQAAAVFVRKEGQLRSVLFKKERDRHHELWHGPMLSLAEAQDQLGFDSVLNLADLEKELQSFVKGVQSIFMASNGVDPHVLGQVQRALDGARIRRHGVELRETQGLLAELRLVKDALEQEFLGKAAGATSAGHARAMQMVQPGWTELRLQAELEAEFKRQGATGLGYSSIVASGANGCCLHYTRNQSIIEPSDLVLIDAGASYNDYTADVTRTFPASGRFTAEQALVYDIVLDVQELCLASVRPGASHHELQNLAIQRLCTLLEQAGLLDRSANETIETSDYKRFYPHSLGHWLGRDVHDVGPSYRAEQPRPFEPGHVLTIEPGVYFQLDDERVPQAFRGMGIRIEDDVLVTPAGCRVLTDVVKSRKDIEEWMAQGRRP
jgi:Xaa-Pro aminopeptidase